jgi:predicted ATP-grasp superfamily ATP-dependent carboligase
LNLAFTFAVQDLKSLWRWYRYGYEKELTKMKRESVVRKNLDLLDEFMKYAFDHPEILDTIPRERTLVILPEGDAALERQNRKTLRRLKAAGEKAVTIRLKATKRKVSKVG